jgi:hypothetical protein
MNFPAETRTLDPEPVDGKAWLERDDIALPAVPLLPVVTRSVSLLTLLLQDSAVDLELASSVVGVDPGLAFGTLYLANRERKEDCDPIWQLPQAIVAAGREALELLLQRCPRIESWKDPAARARAGKLAEDAVVRACIMHFLARELGSANPRKSYLCGLLFEVPALAQLSSPPVSQTALLSMMCRTLPSGIVRAAVAKPTGNKEDGTSDPLVATALAADAVLRAKAATAESADSIRQLTDRPFWLCWKQADALQRAALLNRCGDVAEWARASLRGADPWAFMARLERCRPWEEQRWKACAH